MSKNGIKFMAHGKKMPQSRGIIDSTVMGGGFVKKTIWRRVLCLPAATAVILCAFSGCAGNGKKKIEYESLAQQAVVETALAYLARGSRIQYADTRLATGDLVPSQVRYRWERGQKSPEDATSQYYAYTNCAAFTYDVYYHALNQDILSYTTASLIQTGADQMMFKYFPTGKETEEEMAELEQKFRDTLKVGDIIVVRYNGSRKGNGHAMLYVGAEVLENVIADKNNQAEGNTVQTTAPTSSVTEKEYVYDIIHSGGGNYNYSTFTEKFEQKGSISMTSVDMLFDPISSRYVFSKLLSIGIVRPLNVFDGEVPEESVNRINNLYGIVAEKLSSHTVGMTVNPGEEITFTFSVENTNANAVTLEVKDTVPSGTAYVSGAETVTGNELSWKLTVPGGETKTVSYTVKVNDDAAYGDVISGASGSVGGVSVSCPQVVVAKSLTADQQNSLLAAVQTYTASELNGTALANAIYTEAFGTKDVLPSTCEALLESVFDAYLGTLDYFTPAADGACAAMLVPTMYGGRYTIPDFGVEEAVVRTRLPYKHQLMVGDILVASENADGTMLRLFLLMGDTAYDLLNGMAAEDCNACLEKVLGCNRFAVLRPSMAMSE